MREHIEAAGRHDDQWAREVIARIALACWPGGSADRIDRGATEWLRRWRPSTIGAALPLCSCADGRCAVCN